MYKCLCTSARNALRCRESALQLLCEATLELDGHNRKLHEIKVSHTDPSKRSIFQRMSGGGDAAEQIAKYEAKVAAEADLLSTRRQCYSEVRSLFRAIFLEDASRLDTDTLHGQQVCRAIQEDTARLHSMQLQDFKTMMLSFALSQVCCFLICVAHHTSHITRHTSHVTHHTSHVTHHASHVSLQH